MRVFLDVAAAGEATLDVAGSWSVGARASKTLSLQVQPNVSVVRVT